MAFDAVTGQTLVFYRDSSGVGKVLSTSISGSDVSLAQDPVTFNAAGSQQQALAYDSTNDAFLIGFRDSTANQGQASVIKNTGGYPSLTVGSTYYVQDDGTLSTTSSSTTAGKAIGTSTLLLKG
jgi:hypothetical protein